jgi:hypothetical protein
VAILVPALAPIAVRLALWSGIGVVAFPPDTRCPSRQDLLAAMAARVPDDDAGWVVSYRVEARPDPPVENRLRFELRDGTGRLRLGRNLVIDDEGCAAAAEGLALIVERFFEQVAWTASVPLPEIERSDEPAPTRRWELQVGAAGRLEVALVPALAVDLRLRFSGPWLATAGLVLQPIAAEQDVGTGTRVQLLSLPARLSLRRVLTRDRNALEIGPALTLVGEQGSAGGEPRYRMLLDAGVVAAGRRSLSPDWSVAVEVGADVTLSGSRFVVSGAGPGEVLAPRRIQVIGMLGVSRVLSR